MIPKYYEFLDAFPTVRALSQASPGSLLRVWKGMGYNRRAIFLQRAARIIVETYHGKFPQIEGELVNLPGVGTYTARAILVFAFKKNLAMVDTNIRRIITHFFYGDLAQKPSKIQWVAGRILPRGKSWEWHQALMDYGALELSKIKRPERSRRTSIPFRDSNRYFRGRIIDRLREKRYPEGTLIKSLKYSFGRNAKFYQLLLSQLEKEGLLIKRKNIYSLPT